MVEPFSSTTELDVLVLLDDEEAAELLEVLELLELSLFELELQAARPITLRPSKAVAANLLKDFIKFLLLSHCKGIF